jgi:HEAT repeat protein
MLPAPMTWAIVGIQHWVLLGAPVQGHPPEHWVELLGAPSLEAREQATAELKRLGDAAVPALTPALASPDGEIAARARRILDGLPVRKQLGANLCAAFPDFDDRILASGNGAFPDAFLSLQDRSKLPQGIHLAPEDLALLAGRALAGCTKSLQLAGVIQGAGRLQVKASGGVIRGFLRHRSPSVRGQAASALGAMGDVEGIPGLELLLKDPDAIVRGRAIDALGLLGAAGATDKIAEALQTTDGNAGTAAEALAMLGAQTKAKEIGALLAATDARTRSTAAWALGILGAKEFVRDLAKLLEDPAEEVRTLACLSLGYLAGDEAVQALTAALEDREPSVKIMAIRALGECGACPVLVGVLGDGRRHAAEVRAEAAEALRHCGDRTGTAALEAAMGRDEGVIPRRAAESLCWLGQASGRKGVFPLVEGAAFLNGIAAPEAWRKARATSVSGPIRGRLNEIGGRLADALGVRLVVEVDGTRVESFKPPWEPDLVRIRFSAARLIERMERVYGVTVVIEGDRLRLLNRQAGRDHWKTWAERAGDR